MNKLITENQWKLIGKRFGLTPREIEVAELWCDGLTTGLIAKRLGIAEGTVKTHARNIYGKLQIREGGKKIVMLLMFMEFLSGQQERQTEGAAHAMVEPE